MLSGEIALKNNHYYYYYWYPYILLHYHYCYCYILLHYHFWYHYILLHYHYWYCYCDSIVPFSDTCLIFTAICSCLWKNTKVIVHYIVLCIMTYGMSCHYVWAPLTYACFIIGGTGIAEAAQEDNQHCAGSHSLEGEASVC